MAEYIEREAALALVRPDAPEDEKAAVTIATAKKLVRDLVNRTPAADVAPVVHGVWIPVHESEISGWNPEVAGIDPIGGYICSACKNEAVYDCNDKFVLSDYCPNCGARMDGDDDAKES